MFRPPIRGNQLKFTYNDLRCTPLVTKIFKLLIHSLCPSIYGHDLVKAGLHLGLFG